MAIDLTTERILNLSQAAKYFPSYRGGKPAHVSRVLRAIQNGSLEGLRFNNQWVTSVEAIQRFAERSTPTGRTTPADAPASRRRAIEAAERELDRIGI
jgi:hypothetical protein